VICLKPQIPHNASTNPTVTVAIIGGGPAGLMAAEIISHAGFAVSVYDAMPSVGRKFLLAGVGGMNLTHAEAPHKFLARYTDAEQPLTPFIQAFDAQALRDWAQTLGIDTFVGSSQRVFPKDLKAAPLLRAWLHRLREQGVTFFPRHRWLGWTESGALRFTATGRTTDSSTEKAITPTACVLALGGASWARLGSDGAWVPLLRERGTRVSDLQPSNCGFETNWSDYFSERFAGEPLNTIGLTTTDVYAQTHSLRGECTISRYGIEGSAVYALSAIFREQINLQGHAQLSVDLLPNHSIEKIYSALQKRLSKESFSNFLRKQLKLTPVKIALLKELLPVETLQDIEKLATAIKALPLTLHATRSIDEAISSAGGVCFSALNQQLMLRDLPGVFCAGEMLDWEAPTGGYLLSACFATGKAAGEGVVNWLRTP
jgi:hypothetical protein